MNGERWLAVVSAVLTAITSLVVVTVEKLDHIENRLDELDSRAELMIDEKRIDRLEDHVYGHGK